MMNMNYKKVVVLAVVFTCLYILFIGARQDPHVENSVELDQPEEKPVKLETDSSYTYPTYPATMTISGKDRRPSYPYITGDGFRALCPHRCELPHWKSAACLFKRKNTRYSVNDTVRKFGRLSYSKRCFTITL